MNYLIINTAQDRADYGLRSGNKDFIISAPKSAKHSETALVYVDQLLQEADLTLKDIDCFGVNVGPGSFTGIRIGMSMLKGFMAVFDKPVVAYNSLEAAGFEREGLIAMRASKDDYYCGDAHQDKVDNLRVLTNEQVDKIKDKYIFEELDVRAQLDLVEQKCAQKQFVSSKTLAPLYMKLSQAERQLKEVNT